MAALRYVALRTEARETGTNIDITFRSTIALRQKRGKSIDVTLKRNRGCSGVAKRAKYGCNH